MNFEELQLAALQVLLVKLLNQHPACEIGAHIYRKSEPMFIGQPQFSFLYVNGAYAPIRSTYAVHSLCLCTVIAVLMQYGCSDFAVICNPGFRLQSFRTAYEVALRKATAKLQQS